MARLLVAPVAACGSTSSTPSKSDGGAGTSGSQSPSGSASSSQAALPFNSDHLLKGNAKPNFPDGAANTVAVVQQGPVINLGNGAGAYIPIAFRNNTSKAISHVDWTGVAKVGGKIVSTGESQGTDPAQIAPGAVGLSYVYFSTKVPPPNAAFTFSEESSAADKSFFNTASLRVTQANKSETASVVRRPTTPARS